MLVGQRHWFAGEGDGRLVFGTEAYERPRTILNQIGMAFGARWLQMGIWRAYLHNILDHLQSSGSIREARPQEVNGTRGDRWNLTQGASVACDARPASSSGVVSGMPRVLRRSTFELLVVAAVMYALWSRVLSARLASVSVVLEMIAWIGVAMVVATFFDSSLGRRWIARRLRALAERVRAGEPAARQRLLLSAHSSDRFESCYALTITAELRVEDIDEELIAIISARLESGDPFVRHAAATTLYRLGPFAVAAIEQLQATAEQFGDESGGTISHAALNRLRRLA
jgi:hypothetical protein